jgi:hypothetical protein
MNFLRWLSAWEETMESVLHYGLLPFAALRHRKASDVVSIIKVDGRYRPLATRARSVKCCARG